MDGRQSVLVSGGLWPISADEAIVLTKYRAVRDDGNGFLTVVFDGGLPVKLDEKFGAGVQHLRSVFPNRKLKD